MSGKSIKHPIRIAAIRTGLSTHVIRMWERRYEAVRPTRTSGNQRQYTEEDIERLRLLARLTSVGHSIAQLAHLSQADLASLAARIDADAGQPGGANGNAHHASGGARALELLERCQDATRRLDAELLESTLLQALRQLSVPVLLEQLAGPLMEWTGEEWRAGRIRVANEHMASAALKTALQSLRRSHNPKGGGPVLVVTTPALQWHEVGALMAAVTGATEGWHTVYLGPNLPAEEIAGAAVTARARAVALSIVYPADDPGLVMELLQLRRLLPPQVSVFAGGRSAAGYAAQLPESVITPLPDTHTFRTALAVLGPDVLMPQTAPPGTMAPPDTAPP